MKNSTLFLSLALCASLCLSSCDNKKKCWSINSSLSGVSSTKYFWGTEDEAVAEIKRMEGQEGRMNVTKTEEKSYKTMEDCLSHNY